MVMNMTLNISELRNLVPESIWFEITADLRERVERDIDRTQHSNQIAKYHARLNRLSLYALQSWIESQADKFDRPIELFPSAEGLPWIWEITNGTALNIGNTRLVIIPSDFIDTEELIVPQEWVDVPSWAGNYYLAVQVDEENGRICLWGYISYDEVKKLGKFDDIYRNYHLDREDLHDDFEVLWLDCQINTAVQLQQEALPQVDDATAERLIAKIETPNIFSPRLDLKFDDLKNILNDLKHLKKLYTDRNRIRLPDWLNKIGDEIIKFVDKGYIEIKDLVNQPDPLPGYMGTWASKFNISKIDLSTESKQRDVVNSLYANQHPDLKVDLPSNIESSELLLLYLMQHTVDEPLRWKAAEYLWTIEPNNSNKLHRRIKSLSLVIGNYKLGLMVAIIPLLDGNYAVLNRVYPIDSHQYLPSNVRLTLLSEDNEQLYQVQSRASNSSAKELTGKDPYIQTYFVCNVGNCFNVCVSVDNANVTELYKI
jgi:hypothetical protein